MNTDQFYTLLTALILKGKTTSNCRDAWPCVSTSRASLQIISDRIVNNYFRPVIFICTCPVVLTTWFKSDFDKTVVRTVNIFSIGPVRWR